MSKFKAAKEAGKLFEYYFDRLLRGFRKDQGREPENLEIILIRQEAGNKAKEADKVVEVQFGKPFGEEVNKLIESGDVKIGEVTKKNNNVLRREMFQNSNLNKPTIEGQMEKITGASNRIDEIMKEQADMYRPKTDEEIAAKFEKQNKEAAERLRKKMKDEPEDKADGGRMGFAGGKIVLGKKILNLLKNNKKIQEAVDNIFGTGDYKMDAEMAAESLVELNPTTFGNKLYEDLDDITRSEIYGAVLRPITTNMAKMRELKKASRPEKTLAAMKEGKGIDMSNPEIADEFTRFMKETSPDDYKKLEQTVELANFDPKKVKGNAEGGRIGYYTGGITDIEPDLSDIGHGSDSLMARTRLVSPDGQATTSTGLNYLLAEDNDNIRVPFAKGKIAKEVLDKGRRGFMKAAGAAGAGIAALKTGLLGFGEKAAPVVEKVAETAKGVPPYFFKLVDKIKSFGEDVTEKAATLDRQKVTKYKDFELTEDVATGEMTIQRMKVLDDGSESYYGKPLTEETYMNYKPGKGQADESTKGIPPDEYEQGTAYIRSDREYAGEVVDESFEISDDVLEEVGETITKKAEGGRIGFNKGKLVMEGGRKFLEKVFGKERFQNIIENDPRMEQGMLEVVDMFRKKDKEGLKMYLQKFMPHMDDAEIEDFIVGSDGTEGITGQLIRLGSGREYESLIDMKKQADEIRKLENFDVEGVSKNAEGGRIGLFLGGGLTAGKGLLRTMLNFMAEKSTAGKKGSEILQLVNPKQLDPFLNNPATMGKVSPEAPAGIPEIINAKKKEMTEDRASMVGDLIGTARQLKKVDDDVANYKKTIINDMIGRGIDKETAEQMAETLAEMVAKNAGKGPTPNITDEGLLELENIQKNLLTKDRKLQAQGGLTTMLGE
jgi:hypothetical protein